MKRGWLARLSDHVVLVDILDLEEGAAKDTLVKTLDEYNCKMLRESFLPPKKNRSRLLHSLCSLSPP